MFLRLGSLTSTPTYTNYSSSYGSPFSPVNIFPFVKESVIAALKIVKTVSDRPARCRFEEQNLIIDSLEQIRQPFKLAGDEEMNGTFCRKRYIYITSSFE
ncbi:unnamed protein product [Adineta ricciae]|uniref:Uncharacterized protein n=1 Tax=Adineta ricciae TaxID=249248 RepID=A0A815U377_ADIRI|nr:unnamed protein product [Adineta ricciae]